DNIALKEDNIALKEDNIVLKDDNIALKEDNIALKKKRISKEKLREIILGYCTQWRSVEEISNFVGKQKSYIGNIVLPQLLDALEKKYDVPHHPKQQYRVKE
ncbi:MAG: hypothetical protein U0K59_01185, partial [Bacteroidales bacterium]|nr:hypothetical protein [Bacteroidales bacterium]